MNNKYVKFNMRSRFGPKYAHELTLIQKSIFLESISTVKLKISGYLKCREFTERKKE